MALSFLRKVHAAAAKGTASEVRGGVPLEIAYYLLNRKKRDLAQIEDDYDISVTVKGKTSFLMNQVELEVVKREKVPAADERHLPEATEALLPEPVTISAHSEKPDEPVADETVARKKKKRSRKKKAGDHAELSPAEHPVEDGEEIEMAVEGGEEELPVLIDELPTAAEEGEHAAEVRKKKRRRRRKKGKSDSATVEHDGEAPEPQLPAEELPPVTEVSVDGGEETAPSAEAKKKRRRRKRKTKPAADSLTAEQQEVVVPEESVAAIAIAVVVEPEPVKKAAPRRSSKTKVEITEESTGNAVMPEVPAAVEPAAADTEKVAKPRRKSTKKAAAVVADETAEPAVADNPKKPARKARPQKKQPDDGEAA
jgi:ribonuclease E